ncbi:uncharacterized protein G6M90_00g078880 [Metarhizium brunneum]|uniref:Uncharacterized protein n=1 Tax=Metarhizium brunneum TaxID=500148 RepID=A0A7D5YTP0_9HYPO|nr:hypothetical protein G6M90_00g078880 [Metarhizium brunneum]
MRVVPAFWGFDPAPISPHYKTGLIICGFPGIGKSELADQPLLVPDYRIIELDSAGFFSFHGSANFVAEYCKALKEACQRNTIVLASTHDEVLDQLSLQPLPIVLLHPRWWEKDQWIARLQSRGASDALVNLVQNDWYTLMDNFTRFTNFFAYSIASDANLLQIIEEMVTGILDHLEVLGREIGAEGG